MANGLLNQLLAYWTLNESSGNRADSTGNGNTMVQTGSVTGASGFGNVGNVSVWSGTNSNYLQAGSKVISASPYTFAGWFNFSASAIDLTIFSQSNFLSPWGITIKHSTSKLSISMTNAVNGATILSTGTWYHVAVVYDGTTMRAYLNGSSTAEASLTRSFVNPSANTRLGNTSANSTPFAGSLVGWGVWSRVLSATDISNLYNSGNGVSFSMLDNGAGAAPAIQTRFSMQGGVGAYGGLTVPERFVGKLPPPKVRNQWGPNRGSARDGEGLLAQLREAKDRGAEERELVELLTLLEMAGVL